MDTIETAGDLREYLCNAVKDVVNGDLDLDKAREITKLTTQVNNSMNVEIKAIRLEVDLSRKPKTLGDTPINDHEPEEENE